MTTQRERNPLLYGALDLAEMDIPVFPLRPRSKIPAISKKRGGNGNLDATTDFDQIVAWWMEYQNANVAMRTGVTVDVVDLDSPAAVEAIKALEGYEPIGAPRVKTSRGWHLWFRSTGLQSRTAFLPECDFRGKDASATCPPSVHESGHVYRYCDLDFSNGAASLDAIPEIPLFLRKAIRPPEVKRTRPSATTFMSGGRNYAKSEKWAKNALVNELNALRLADKGTRNDTLNTVSFNIGQIVADGYVNYDGAFDLILDAALEIGLPQREAEPSIKSGLTKGQQEPRSHR